jgi:lipid-A-disaccharide synthase
LQSADAALVASGTATLETMLVETPMVVAYRLAPMTAWILRRFGLLRTRFFSLPNLIAGKALVSERLQEQAEAGLIAGDLLALLAEGGASEQQAQFKRMRGILRQDADQRAADAVAGLVERRRSAGQ